MDTAREILDLPLWKIFKSISTMYLYDLFLQNLNFKVMIANTFSES